MPNVTTRNISTLPDGEHFAADNLYLLVRGSSRSFVFRYVSPSGVRRRLSLGSAKKITLSEARAEADRCRVILAKGIDPKDLRDKEKAARRTLTDAEQSVVFRNFAAEALDEFLNLRKLRPISTYRYRRLLDLHLIPLFGGYLLEELTGKEIARVLRPLWEEKPTTATLVRYLLEKVLGIAVRDGLLSMNPAAWQGNLDAYLPSPKKVKQVEHRAAISLSGLKEIAPRLFASASNVERCALFIALTACRSKEAYKAEWVEFDPDFRVWTIPPERRKDGRPEPFRVPLSDQARALILSTPRVGRYVFSAKNKRFAHTSNRPLGGVIKRVSGDHAVTIHGLRSTFSQWAAENGVDFEVRETCLMHAVGNAVTRAYQRSDLLEKRREVLQRWADEILPPGDEEA